MCDSNNGNKVNTGRQRRVCSPRVTGHVGDLSKMRMIRNFTIEDLEGEINNEAENGRCVTFRCFRYDSLSLHQYFVMLIFPSGTVLTRDIRNDQVLKGLIISRLAANFTIWVMDDTTTRICKAHNIKPASIPIEMVSAFMRSHHLPHESNVLKFLYGTSNSSPGLAEHGNTFYYWNHEFPFVLLFITKILKETKYSSSVILSSGTGMKKLVSAFTSKLGFADSSGSGSGGPNEHEHDHQLSHSSASSSSLLTLSSTPTLAGEAPSMIGPFHHIKTVDYANWVCREDCEANENRWFALNDALFIAKRIMGENMLIMKFKKGTIGDDVDVYVDADVDGAGMDINITYPPYSCLYLMTCWLQCALQTESCGINACPASNLIQHVSHPSSATDHESSAIMEFITSSLHRDLGSALASAKQNQGEVWSVMNSADMCLLDGDEESERAFLDTCESAGFQVTVFELLGSKRSQHIVDWADHHQHLSGNHRVRVIKQDLGGEMVLGLTF